METESATHVQILDVYKFRLRKAWTHLFSQQLVNRKQPDFLKIFG